MKIQKSHELFEFSKEMSFSKLKNELINQNSFFDEIFKDSSIKSVSYTHLRAHET